MKLFFLIFIVPFAIVAQDIAIDQPLVKPRPAPLPVPIKPPVDTRVLPKKPFVVVSNGIIRRKSPFNVAIRRFGSTSRSVYLTLILAGSSDNGVPYSSKKYAKVSSGSTSAWVSFDTSKISPGSYSLKVEGEGFEEKRSLVYATKDSSLLVQLEKAIYSPGQVVNYRIFAIDSLTNAVTPSDKCSVTIRDSNGNLIDSYSGPKFEKGKYENKLFLGLKAPLGVWALEVVCGSESAYEQFEIAEYKLPPYSIEVSVPSNTPFSNGKVPVQIKAIYSFEEPVEGTGTFEVSLWGNNVLSRTVEISNGEASFELDNVNDLQTDADGYFYFAYTFTATDSIMNSKVVTEGYFLVLPWKYNIQMNGKQYLEPGKVYDYSVLVSSEDNSFPPEGTVVQVTIYPQNIVQELTLNNAGSASSSISVPSDTTYLSFSAQAPESSQGSLYAYYQTGSPGVITLSPNVQGENGAKIGSWFSIKALVTDKVDWLVYYVAAKGVLLDSQRVSFKSKSKSATIWVKPDIRYFPRFTVIAAYLKGVDIIVGQVEVDVRDGLNNFVKLNFKEVEVKPGVNFNYTVESRCDSTVSLSAIDTRVLQLRSGNEIEYNDVLNSMYAYEWDTYLPWEGYTPPYVNPFTNTKLRVMTNIPPPPEPEYQYKFLPDRPEANEKEAARPNGPGGAEDVKVRKDFSETFCWTDVVTKSKAASSSEECGSSCIAKVSCPVSESITKYLVYSVSMNTKYGIGVTDTPSSIIVKLPFFIDWTPPYSIQRNELLLVDLAVFNNINQDQDIKFTITKTGNFEAINLADNGWTETATGFEKTVQAKASENFKQQFEIKFTSIGVFYVKIVAAGGLAGDGIERPIRVIPEGIPRTITKSVMIVKDQPEETNLQCEYPAGTYGDTKQVLATVIGDILGKAMNNLDRLIQMPGGCGEQNMLGLVPNVAVYLYLNFTNKLTDALKTTLNEYTKVGYMNQLNYQRNDGSFSAFGNSDPSGSSWLTTYTALFFNYAKVYMIPDSVDDDVIRNALNFVIAQQNSDGSFSEPGRVIHVDMQGGAGNGLALTAYISYSLSIMSENYPEFITARDNSVAYLEGKLNDITDVYELAITTLALKLAKSNSTLTAFDKFYALKIDTGTEIFWQKTFENPNSWYGATSLNIETTGYGLINLVNQNNLADSIKALKFLTGQANKFGGYSSSQDTAVGLMSLAFFAWTYSLDGASVDVTLSPDAGASFVARVDSSNAMTLQQFELSSETTELSVTPNQGSTGLAIVSLICNFYQDPAQVIQTFNINYEYYRQCRWSVGLRVCASYIPEGNSNMAIISVNLPSGFQYQEWWGGSNNPDVTKVETYNSGSKVVFYFNSIGNKDTCIDVNAWRAQTVSDLKGGNIIVNDYYDTSKEGSAKYPAPDLSGQCWYR